MELACRGHIWLENEDSVATDLFRRWREENPNLNSVWREFLRGPSEGSLSFRPLPYEYMYLPAVSLLGPSWDSFLKRFEFSMRDAGFSPTKAKALVGAMREMADNVWNHSGASDADPSPAMIAYHVTDGAMTFAVADIGRGVLESLRSAVSQWQDVTSSSKALEVAVQRHGSRRVEFPNGEGFKQVLRSLADLNGEH